MLPAFIAEMDYDLAEPVAAALRAAVDLDDCGYATPDGVGETFAAFAASRHGWAVDPGLVHLIPDVMAGVDALLNLATEPGDGVVINTPVYPPFFAHIGFARRRVVEVPLLRRTERTGAGNSTSPGSRRRSPRARAATCSATRTTRPAGCSARRTWAGSRRWPTSTASS